MLRMTKRLLVLIGFVASLNVILANPVEESTAKEVVKTFLMHQNVRIGELYLVSNNNYTEFYVFQNSSGGFVIVAADDCVVPVLAYSLENTFSLSGIPSNVDGWLRDLEKEIRACKESPDASRESGWDENQFLNKSTKSSVSPLIQTRWDQAPYYNAQCPYSSTYNENAVTGCVATAVAQIMKYWDYPSSGYGSHSYYAPGFGTQSANFNTTYQWSAMPNSLSSASSSSAVNAVAKLMYHIGVAVEMGYGVAATGGSGALNYNPSGTIQASAQTAFMRYFKYKPTLSMARRQDYTVAEWQQLLKSELNAGRPILYSGRDYSGGHSFVCDGYDNNNRFHFNWGWGGYCDGYYAIGSLNPSAGGAGGNSSYTFNLTNVAVVGIEPNYNWSATQPTVVSVATDGGSSSCYVTGAGSYSYGQTVTLTAYGNGGSVFSKWSDGCLSNPRYFVANGGNLHFTAEFIGGITDDCEPLMTHRYRENFNTTAASEWNEAGGELPDCWNGYSNGTNPAYFPHVTASGSYHYSPDNTKSLTMTSGTGTYGTVKMVYLPKFDFWSLMLEMTFCYKMQSASQGTLTVGYVTDVNDPNSFHPIKVLENKTVFTYDTIGVSGYGSQVDRYAIRWECNGTARSVGIDNVRLTGFHHSCNADFPYVADFNESNPVNYNVGGGELPDCMEPFTNGTDERYMPHVTGGGLYHYSFDGTNSLTMVSGSGSYGTVKMVALPDTKIDVGRYAIAFDYQMASTATGTLSVGAIEVGMRGDYRFDQLTVAEEIPNSTTKRRDTVYLSSVWMGGNALCTKSIAFKWECDGALNAVGIDNIVVYEAIPRGDEDSVIAPYFQDFNTTAASEFNTLGGSLPDGWYGHTSGTDLRYLPHVVDNGEFHYSPDGSKSLSMSNASHDNECGHYKVVLLPRFIDTLNTLSIALTYRMTSNSGYYGLEVGYEEDPDDCILCTSGSNLIIPIARLPPTDTFITDTIRLDSIPFYGIGVRIALAYYDWDNTVWIDNVKVFRTVPRAWSTIAVLVNNPDAGTVEGSGTYTHGSTVILEAKPNRGYQFVRWDDYNYENPRAIIVEEDRTYTAFFAPVNGVNEVHQEPEFILQPNPTKDQAILIMKHLEEKTSVELMSSQGQIILNRTYDPSEGTDFVIDVGKLSKGLYFVVIRFGNEKIIKKLIVL